MLSQFVNSMYHFFVPEAGDGPEIVITGGDVNHIRNVLRMKPGEKVVNRIKFSFFEGKEAFDSFRGKQKEMVK